MYGITKNIPKLTIKDLRKHDIVKVSQIDTIYDTYMLLINSRMLPDGDIEGEIVYFGDGESDEYNNWFFKDTPLTPLYFDKAEMLGEVFYDE